MTREQFEMIRNIAIEQGMKGKFKAWLIKSGTQIEFNCESGYYGTWDLAKGKWVD